VPQERFPVLWLGQAAVVSLPAEIDILLADQVREDLLSVLNRGPAALIVDMSRTTFCDSAGVHALVRAHKRAAASSADMRLVVTAPGVLRVLAITGVDRLIAVSASVSAALAAAGQPADGEKAAPGPGQAATWIDPDDREPQPS
jgi:anti-sigma B factor antagonist